MGVQLKDVQHLIKDLEIKIDELQLQSKKASHEVQQELDKKIKTLRTQASHLKNDLESFKDGADNKWVNSKVHFSKAIDEMKVGFSSLFGKS
ncbi:sll1863 family stress response protein [Pararhodonellum marinum]|uniref:hypothetical protein n=1 Tax=Pararhodonellum marinum TaxID=2755358 RepID=UPI00188DE58F|nr:hypothetical protein [Pararhodonellum marinum]